MKGYGERPRREHCELRFLLDPCMFGPLASLPVIYIQKLPLCQVSREHVIKGMLKM